jgi:hypothetical protein
MQAIEDAERAGEIKVVSYREIAGISSLTSSVLRFRSF